MLHFALIFPVALSLVEDCSFAVIDGIRYQPLGANGQCLPDLTTTSSTRASCDYKENVILSTWIGDTLCRGSAAKEADATAQVTAVQCNTECSDEKSLLPPVSPPVTTTTSKPTPKPTPKPNPSKFGDEPDPQTTSDPFSANEAPSTAQPFATPSLPIHGSCLLTCVLLFIGALYHLLIKQHDTSKKRIVLNVKIFVLFTFISNIVGILCIMSVSIIMTTREWNIKSYNLALIPYYGISVAYCCGKFSLECFFLFRVYSAFRKSTYALSNCTCIVLICWMFMVSFMWCYMFLMHNDTNRTFIISFMYILVCILEALLIVVMLYLFLKRLSMLILRHKITMPQANTSHESQHSNNSNISANDSPIGTNRQSTTTGDVSVVRGATKRSTSNGVKPLEIESNLSTKQSKWIFLITRCILLSSIALISTILFGFFAFYSSQYHTIDIYVVYALWSLDMTTNSVCLYLNFIFANNLYNWGCDLCHRLCQKMVQYLAVKKLFKRYANDVKNLQKEATSTEIS